MKTLQEAKAAFEEARTNYCHALARGNARECVAAKKLQATRLAECGRIVKAGMSNNY